MTEASQEIIKHINAAIDLESESAQLYKDLAEKAKTQYAESIFKRMIEEEMKHLEFVRSLKRNFAKSSDFDGEEMDELNALSPKDIISIRDKSKEEATKNYLNALVTIVEFEERAHTFYRDLESSTENRAGREIFKTLAQFEKEHLDMFQEELDSIKDNPYL